MVTLSFFAPGVSVSQTPFITDVLRTDGRARVGLAASLQQSGYRDEVEIVTNLSIPLAILHGKKEQLVNGTYFSKLTIPTLWQNKVQVIVDAGHVPHWEQPDIFNMLLEQFIMSL